MDSGPTEVVPVNESLILPEPLESESAMTIARLPIKNLVSKSNEI